MCRNIHDQRRIIDDAKLDATRVYAVYNPLDDNDLVAIIKVLNGTLALLLEVRGNDLTCTDHASYMHGMTRRALSERFYLPSVYRLQAC